MRAVIQSAHLCFAATVTPDGRPNVSPKGTIRVCDDARLFFLDIASPGTRANGAIAMAGTTSSTRLSARLSLFGRAPRCISRPPRCTRTACNGYVDAPPLTHRRRWCCSRSTERLRCSHPRAGAVTTRRRFEQCGASGGPRWIVSSRRTWPTLRPCESRSRRNRPLRVSLDA